MMDYFGNYKSPEWEEMQQIEDENEQIETDLPEMESEIEKLQADLLLAKRKTKIVQAYRAADPESTVRNLISVTSSNNLICTECDFIESNRSEAERFRKVRTRP